MTLDSLFAEADELVTNFLKIAGLAFLG